MVEQRKRASAIVGQSDNKLGTSSRRTASACCIANGRMAESLVRVMFARPPTVLATVGLPPAPDSRRSASSRGKSARSDRRSLAAGAFAARPVPGKLPESR
jgi:hypothetical protein